MSWNQGQPGTHHVPTTRGMVKVLPSMSFSGQRLPQQQRPNLASGNSFGDFAQSRSYNSLPRGASTKQEVPRIPPPPPQLRRRRSGGNLEVGRPESKNTDLFQSMQAGGGVTLLQQPNGMVNGFYDKRRLHASLYDLRAVENSTQPYPQQHSQVRPLNLQSNSNRLSLNMNDQPFSRMAVPIQPQSPQTQYPSTFTPTKPSFQSYIASSAGNVSTKTSQRNESQMNSLFNEMSELRRELAAMKDPMQEHEEWLRSQSVQVKELEELQKQLQSSIEVGKQEPRKTSPTNPFYSSVTPTPSPVSSPVSKLTITPPVRDFRPPITSPKPKPNQPRPSSVSPVKSSSPVPPASRSEGASKPVQQIKKTTTEESFPKTPSSTQQTTPTTSNAQVKRISQLFEANDERNKKDEVVSSKPSTPKTSKNATVGKLSPALLQSLKTLEYSPPTNTYPKSALGSDNGQRDTRFKGQPMSESLTVQNKSPPKLASMTAVHSRSPTSIASSGVATTHKPLVPPNTPTTKYSTKVVEKSSPVIPSVPYTSKPVTVLNDHLAESTMPTGGLPKVPAASKKPSVVHASTKPTTPSVPVEPKKPAVKPTLPTDADMPRVPVSTTFRRLSSAFAESSSLTSISTLPPPVFPSVPPASTKPTQLSSPSIETQIQQTTASENKRNHASKEALEFQDSQNSPKVSSHSTHRYANISDEQLEDHSPSNGTYTPKAPPPVSPQALRNNNRYDNISDEAEFQQTTQIALTGPAKLKSSVSTPDLSLHRSHPNSPNAPVSKYSQISVNSAPSQQNQTLQSTLQVSVPKIRPSTPPPPPPSGSPQNLRASTNSTGKETSVPLSTPPPPPPPPETPSTIAPAHSAPGTPDTMSMSTRRSSSGNSSFSSLTGMPLSPADVASNKANLMEQIRLFRQSGRRLKRATPETGESGGTPTRVRKDAIHEALQTRFQAFCGHQSDSSDNDDHDVDDDWDDFD